MTFTPFDTAQTFPRDRISVRDFVQSVEIGAFQAERGVTQTLRFNVVVDVVAAGQSTGDDVDRILSYDTITDAIATALAEQRLNLLETLAERIAALLLGAPQACAVFVQIQKLDRGPFALGVEIARSKAVTAPDAPRLPSRHAPNVVHVTNAALADARLPAWLDQLTALGAPLILTVDLPDLPRPQAQGFAHRVTLLGLDQNAWALAALDPRCTVTATRTEIDWAMGQGQTIVWAPSKMVLDAVSPEGLARRDALELASWLAQTLGAAQVYCLGKGALNGPGAPIQTIALRDQLQVP